jgi:hypothetical protein
MDSILLICCADKSLNSCSSPVLLKGLAASSCSKIFRTGVQILPAASRRSSKDKKGKVVEKWYSEECTKE